MKSRYKIQLNENHQSMGQIYIIPHAGGNYSQYLSYKDLLTNKIETIFLELPGRGSNVKDQEHVTGWNDFIEKSFELVANPDKPTIIMGHSFGSLIAFELVKRLEERGFKNLLLITSAYLAPTTENLKKIPKVSQLSDDCLWEEVKKYGAIPANIVQDPKLNSFFIKPLRFDFEMMESYQNPDLTKIQSPIITLLGADDSIYDFSQMEEWKHFTKNSYKLKIFNGDHFYLLKNAPVVATAINQMIENFLSGSRL
ncbi:MAG: thioesterase [Bacteriovoracaceae bacterium]|nr:thioesterase [Bacteriovoracaceae bacterium]